MAFNPKLVSIFFFLFYFFSGKWSNVAYRHGNLMLLWLTGK